MDKTQIAYKVVRIIRGKQTSAIESGSARVDYTRTGWIYPPKGENPFLFIFNTRRNAAKYIAACQNSYKIIKVLAENCETDKIDVGGNPFSVANKKCWPAGSLLCSRLMVIHSSRRIWKIINNHSKESAMVTGGEAVSYFKNIITIPNHYSNQGLWVFDSLKNATAFYNQWSSNPKSALKICSAIGYNLSDVLYNPSGKIIKFSYDGDCPKGTLFAQAVKIT